MRSYQVFAGLAPKHAQQLLERLAEKAPAMFAQTIAAASAALKARPLYLQRQPFEKRAEAVRRTLSRVATNAIADEVLAVYFLECRKELLVEWLDRVGVAHNDGTLEASAPPPPADAKLRDAVAGYRRSADDPDRELLLRAFAAQDAIEWPTLDALLASPDLPAPAEASGARREPKASAGDAPPEKRAKRARSAPKPGASGPAPKPSARRGRRPR